MRLRRRFPIILGVLLVAAAVALVVVLRKHAPPEPARLLPGADGFVYVNLQWMRRANLVGELPSVSHDPEYEQFIQATGFDFERDLEQAAMAIHYPTSPNSAGPEDTRFSYVFVAKLDGERLRQYLKKNSSSTDDYHSVAIYNIPLEGRTLRVAIIGVDTVAVSNHADPLVIRGIIDRSRRLASPFAGPALLRQYYKEVPLASLAWAVFRIQPSTNLSGPVGLSFLFAKPAVGVVSLRLLRAVHLRAVAFADSEEEAKHISEQLGAFLNAFRTAQDSVPASGSDADVKALFDSVKVEQQKNRAVLTSAVPPGFLRKLLAEGPAAMTPVAPAPEKPGPAPAPPEKKRRKAPK
ncbi:MAG: hypothetical protein WB952_24455 [Terriglobales bacterium]